MPPRRLTGAAEMVVGLATTALPFARNREEEAERWLRLFRRHGNVSAALQELGIGEQPLAAACERTGDPDGPGLAAQQRQRLERREAELTVRAVAAQATRRAGERGSATVTTADLLLGSLDHYGRPFEQLLERYGTSREQVVERVERLRCDTDEAAPGGQLAHDTNSA